MKAVNVPDAGDIAYVDFDPQAGHEQGRRRPALVLTSSEYNGKTGLAIVAPITSKVKGYPFEVAIGSRLRVEGVILVDQLKSVDWRARKLKFACKVDRNTLQLARHLVGELLNI